MNNEMQQQSRTQTTAKLQSDFEKLLDRKAIEFVPFGSNEKIKLTPALIQSMIAVKTKSGKSCSENDAIKFMMMCRAKSLNPFEGDAYLIGYDTNDGPKFSLITAHQAFLKRAEIHPEYDGMKSGIIVLNADDASTTDIEGDFHLPEQQVVGGWATVYFKNRKVPTTRRVRMARFKKNFGVWQDDAAGMIVKCAEADALRSSFPTMVGALYSEGEMDFPSLIAQPLSNSAVEPSRLVSVVKGDEQTQGPGEAEAEPEAEKAAEVPPQEQLEKLIVAAGFTFNHLQTWALETGNIPGGDSIDGFQSVNEKDARRLLKAQAGLLKGLAVVKAKEAA